MWTRDDNASPRMRLDEELESRELFDSVNRKYNPPVSLCALPCAAAGISHSKSQSRAGLCHPVASRVDRRIYWCFEECRLSSSHSADQYVFNGRPAGPNAIFRLYSSGFLHCIL